MSLSPNDVEKIAYLARLKIDASEIQDVTSNLARIIGFVEQLRAADTEGVEPMAHPLAGVTQRLRADEVDEIDQRELFQQNAPAVEAGLYLVPRVLD